MSLVKVARSLLFDPSYFWVLAGLVILGDVLLTQLIIYRVAYTEIDWITYISQIDLYRKGERDYSKITGPTGPLVYPAGHVHLHNLLYDITATNTTLKPAQEIYGILYIASLLWTLAIYNEAGGIPNYSIIFLVLSKRLHSIFVLRLFNDCWALWAMLASVLAYTRGRFSAGSILFSAALSIKMNVLLYLPGLLVVFWKTLGLYGTLSQLGLIVSFQVLLALPFLTTFPLEYLANAFNFSRAFLYKWTVNWRFVDDETFLSGTFAKGLLAGHLVCIVGFALFKWCRADGGVLKVLQRGLRRPNEGAALAPTSPDQITTILFTSNLIGIIFARSLHYQFYSWYALQIPFLAWRTRYPLPLKIALLGGIEYAWNVYPSTSLSSIVLLVSNSLLLVGLWFGYPEGKDVAQAGTRRGETRTDKVE